MLEPQRGRLLVRMHQAARRTVGTVRPDGDVRVPGQAYDGQRCHHEDEHGEAESTVSRPAAPHQQPAGGQQRRQHGGNREHAGKRIDRALGDGEMPDIAGGDRGAAPRARELARAGVDLDADGEGLLPQLSEGERLKLLGFDPEQHFTQPPPRFTQATLIKELEEKGIGRPSTYAAIMTSILNREYVGEDESKRLRPTSLGRVVSELLVQAFPDILEVGFTAQLEDKLDHVEEGRENRVDTLRRFYGPFEQRLKEAKKKMPEVKRKGLPTDIKCELDGGAMAIP